MNSHAKGFGLVVLLMSYLFFLHPQVAFAQVILGGVMPQGGKPVKAITVEFTGQNFKVPLRLSAS
ncbi:MAG: hypothetical protein ACKOCH_27765, partial [Bacteroidota bacterium]